MKINFLPKVAILASLYLGIFTLSVMGQNSVAFNKLWKNPTSEYRMKTWWFFGYENTTEEGIRADIKALKDAGFGGVVYYDQHHNPQKDAPTPGKADDGFSPEWWSHLKYAARTAHEAGLSFELNISNGYCAGGKWIDAQHAMQRLASATQNVKGGRHLTISVPSIPKSLNQGFCFAIKRKDTLSIRHITARYNADGKGRNGAMQIPGKRGEFSGAKFKTLPDIGMLQVSDDSINWHDVIRLEPMYRSQMGYFFRTTSFPATRGKYFRINYFGDARLREYSLGSEAMLDRWEERAALQSDFAECVDSTGSPADITPKYSEEEVPSHSDIIDITENVKDGVLTWDAPDGEWCILHLAPVLTGARSKHGRENLLGYECDKLSVEAATLHWNSYTQVILDSLRADGIDFVEGVTMDSHEGGSQNWTPLMLEEFEKRRGYSLLPYMPVFAGFVVESVEKTSQVLRDLRQTIADCIKENYFGTFERLAHANGLTFTAQAIGNALCITGDAISVKQVVDKPQGEFWTYQQTGAYDIKDCSSAAHLYNKPIASAEAMTDAEYKDNASDLKRVADIAFSFGAQEFVVCATPHIPLAKTDGPYIAGREYAINRSNPKWESFKPVFTSAARSALMLRQGKTAPDVLIYLGDDIPMKTITSRLPEGIADLDWDVCTGDALQHRISATQDGHIIVKDNGITYRALLIADKALISAESQQVISHLKQAGVPVLMSGENITPTINITEGKASIVHTHRTSAEDNIYFLANTTTSTVPVCFKLHDRPKKLMVWNSVTGKKTKLNANADGSYSITFGANESLFLTY